MTTQRSTRGRSTFTAPLCASTNKLWGAHVVVPPAIVRTVTASGSRRIVCTLNGTETFQAALVAYRRGQWVVSVNQTLRRTLGAEIGDDIRVSLSPDQSRYGHAMPPELAEALAQDPEARTYFDALTLGRQRTLLYIINSVKDPLKRAHRAAVILRHLTMNRGALRYRELGAQLRSNRSPR